MIDKIELLKLARKGEHKKIVDMIHPNIDMYGHDLVESLSKNMIDKYQTYWLSLEKIPTMNRYQRENYLNFIEISLNCFYATCKKCGNSIHYDKNNDDNIPKHIFNEIPPCIEDKEYKFKIYSESGKLLISNNFIEYVKNNDNLNNPYDYNFSILKNQIELRELYSEKNIFIGYTNDESIKVTKYGGNINFKPDTSYSIKNTLYDGFWIMATDINNINIDEFLSNNYSNKYIILDVEPNCWYEYEFVSTETTVHKLKKISKDS